MKTNYEKLMKINYEKLLIFYLPFTGTKQSRKEATLLDCFVVPPRNDAKRRKREAMQARSDK